MEERARILVIDDDESILESAKELLSQQGYLVDTAKSGKETLKKLKKNIYNLLLIDIILPDMQGLDLIEKLTDTLPKICKVVITGYASLDNAVRALNLGAHAFIMKPISPSELLGIVEKELRLQREELSELQNQMAEYVEKETENMVKKRNI